MQYKNKNNNIKNNHSLSIERHYIWINISTTLLLKRDQIGKQAAFVKIVALKNVQENLVK